jgi:hypothetical protein
MGVRRERAAGSAVLTVYFDGVKFEGRPGVDITFGRSATMTIRVGPADLQVHRRVGAFHWVPTREQWQLQNDGSTSALEVRIDGGLEAKIAVGAHPMALPADARGMVRILTPMAYELGFVTPSQSQDQSADFDLADDGLDAPTVDPRRGLGLSDAEFTMLVALCEPRLRDPHLPVFTVPSTKDVCARLGITAKKAEDLVDGLAVALSSHVDDVVGSNQGRAVNRRHRIAAFAIDTHCVTARDLRLLES